MDDGARETPPGEEFERLRRRLARAVDRVCPPWLAEHREDITQNALLQLIRAADRSEGNRDYSTTYLVKVAHGATVDEIRRQARRKELAMGEPASIERVADPEAADVEARAAAEELGRAVRDCLTRLVRDRQLAVTLHLLGCSVAEVAQRLHWNRKRSENLVYRGLADLRRCLAGKGFER